MEISELLKIDPSTLAYNQRKALATYAANKLRMIADEIEASNFPEVKKNLAASPAGDECGIDNQYISFAELGLATNEHGSDTGDIGTVIDRLIHLEALQRSIGPNLARGTVLKTKPLTKMGQTTARFSDPKARG